MAAKEIQEQENQEQEKKGGKKKLLILVLLVLLLSGGGAAGYFLFLSPSGNGQDTSSEQDQSNLESRLVKLQPFVVNLSDPLGRRFLKVSLELEMKNEEAVARLQQSLPRVRDAILLLLSSKSFNDLSTMESKMLLKRQLMDRVNQITGGDKAVDVYFTEFVIQ
ncbi:MAG: flagellar basal body-associated FliL family protein [Desulfovibrionales bacterium]